MAAKMVKGSSSSASQNLSRKDHTLVIAVFDYIAAEDDQLSVNRDDRLAVIEKVDDNWIKVRKIETGEEGFVPAAFVRQKDSLQAESWFFDDLDRVESIKGLLTPGYPEGTFCVRPSSRKRSRFIPEGSGYALSVRIQRKHEAEVEHYRIKRNKEGKLYLSQKKPFDKLSELITYHMANPEKNLKLVKPLPKVPPAVQFKDFEVTRDKIVNVSTLGAGNFGTVYKAIWKGLYVAVKQLNVESDGGRKEFMEEARLMAQLRHRNLVTLLGVCTQPENKPVLIICELVPKGALKDVLEKDKGREIHLPELIYMMYQVCLAMVYLEERQFIHRDIRTPNVLVGENLRCKLADFGLARLIDDEYLSQTLEIPYRWTAPEGLLDRKFSTKSDIWAFGILMYEIICYGEKPYDRPPWNEKNKCAPLVKSIIAGDRLPCPDTVQTPCPKVIHDCMLACWNINPDKRPSFKHLLKYLDKLTDVKDDKFPEFSSVSEDDGR